MMLLFHFNDLVFMVTKKSPLWRTSFNQTLDVSPTPNVNRIRGGDTAWCAPSSQPAPCFTNLKRRTRWRQAATFQGPTEKHHCTIPTKTPCQTALSPQSMTLWVRTQSACILLLFQSSFVTQMSAGLMSRPWQSAETVCLVIWAGQ